VSSDAHRIAFIGLGSDLGDRLEALRRAAGLLSDTPGILVAALSPVYETDPVGVEAQPPFLNAVAGIETTLAARALLERCQEIEAELGRERSVRWGPRTIDLDLLLFSGERIDEPDLQVPHPRLAERAFVVRPLADLAPDLRLPDGRTVAEALAAVGEKGVRRYGSIVL